MKKELKIGEEDVINGVKVICKEYYIGDCQKCAFKEKDCANTVYCCSRGGSDGKSVYFEML